MAKIEMAEGVKRSIKLESRQAKAAAECSGESARRGEMADMAEDKAPKWRAAAIMKISEANGKMHRLKAEGKSHLVKPERAAKPAWRSVAAYEWLASQLVEIS